MPDVQLWVGEYNANVSQCSDAAPLFQDGAAGDVVTGKSVAVDFSGAVCHSVHNVAITGIIDKGGIVAVGPADTWQYTIRLVTTFGAIIGCLALPDDPNTPVHQVSFSVSNDGNTWTLVRSDVFSLDGNYTVSDVFGNSANPITTARYMRISALCRTYKEGTATVFVAWVTDLRSSVLGYVTPGPPPPRKRKSCGHKPAFTRRHCANTE